MTDTTKLPASTILTTSEQRVAMMAFAISVLLMGFRAAMENIIGDEPTEQEQERALDLARVSFAEDCKPGPSATGMPGDAMSLIGDAIGESDWMGPICWKIETCADDILDARVKKEEAA